MKNSKVSKIQRSLFVCPVCKSELKCRPNDFICSQCNNEYKLIEGFLPDFRLPVQNKPLLFIGDEKRAETLRGELNSLSLKELIRLCYNLHHSRTPQALDITVDFMLGTPKRVSSALEHFGKLCESRGWRFPGRGSVLDVGCGCGLEAVALAGKYDTVFALNPAMDEMTVATKAVQESGKQRKVKLFAAFAENLPFPDKTFNLIYCCDVIEHVIDYTKVLAECYRVLLPGGVLVFTSPNRFNLFTKEGHVHLRFVGFLPRWLMDPYVRARTGKSYTMRNVRLRSYREIYTALNDIAPSQFYLEEPMLHLKKHERIVRRIARSCRKLVTILWLHLGPIHHVVVRKKHEQ